MKEDLSNTINYLNSNEYVQQIKLVMTKRMMRLEEGTLSKDQGIDKQIHQPNELFLYLTVMTHSMP